MPSPTAILLVMPIGIAPSMTPAILHRVNALTAQA